jgi:hypothetical protein
LQANDCGVVVARAEFEHGVVVLFLKRHGIGRDA